MTLELNKINKGITTDAAAVVANKLAVSFTKMWSIQQTQGCRECAYGKQD